MPTRSAAENSAAVPFLPGVSHAPLTYATPQRLPLEPAVPRAGYVRWVMLGLVFLAITINYIDRMVIGLLAPDYLKQPKGPISEAEYGYIGSAFGVAYALGQAVSGRWLDKIGTRFGYAISLFAWSIVSICHAAARTVLGFGILRSVLGITESPAYPAATKTLAEWFPRKERAFAMGVVNAGASIGSIAAPLLVGALAAKYGWQTTFIATGAIGLAWLFLWIPLYRRPSDHRWLGEAERAYIHSDPVEPPVKLRWLKLLTFRQTWAFAMGKFLTDPIWSFYLLWLPSFLKARYGLSVSQIMWPMSAIYALSGVGGMLGGYLSSSMIHGGSSVNASRKRAMLICALLVIPAVVASKMPNVWMVVGIVGLALAAHQGFSSNLYTLVSDLFPKRAVGSVAGLGGTFGYLGFAGFSALTGKILTWTHDNYLPVFMIGAFAYLLAFLLIQLLAPRLEPAVLDVDDTPEPRAFAVVTR